ncbi:MULTISPECIES: YgfZ/GcvT domain-containing protein [Alphaproteobacteria]|uniref:Aminomethyltransferase n=2 Tax=Alphaproteobacteria TaxID=28211 RepID=A0A512HGC3_9HYPH|nr:MULTISPECIES: folate-binding protein YgfZ [Alphaproteobacteria]GEO84498.1 aminomethyltransferase [Ciceribacter naphthalenivorans]GLR22461.1 aminomethyltransferase [Ciceribacter naphthalenivorans]GLT05317.1 aminomethyltransferase [Sphingomonas psychrolutea]
MPAALLPDRALIRVSGTDAEHFLHNLVTTDIANLPQGEAWPGALLTPQGKVLFDFLVWRDGAAFILDTSNDQRDALIKRLSMYKLRAAVEIAPVDATGMTVAWGEDADTGGLIDHRFACAGVRVTRKAGGSAETGSQAYHALRVLAGIAESGSDFALQDAFPHDILFDLTGGVSFKKGCYVGQEVVSRMQHRGTARRRVVLVTAESDLPPSGTEINAGGKPVGALGTVAGNRALAIVRIDRTGEALATGRPILAGDTPVGVALPGWSGLAFPRDATEEV